MPEDGSLITTGVDRLLGYVQDKQEVELEEAAKALGTDTDTMLEWASSLEDADLIEIHHSPLRGRVLIATEGEVAEETVEEAREEAAEEIRQVEQLKQEKTEMEQFEDVLDVIAQSLEKDEAEAEELTDTLEGENLERLRDYLEELQEAETGVAELEEQLEDAIAGIEVLIQMEQEVAASEGEDGAETEETEETGETEGGGVLDRVAGILPWREQTFKCGECGREFDSRRGMRTHQGMVHDD